MQLELKSTERHDIFQEIAEYLTSLKINVVSKDFNRPWGGFFVIDEDQAQQFAELFFPGKELSSLRISGKLSPKILVVEPGKRLSWQYHNRRAEIWRSLSNNVGVITSATDEEDDVKTLKAGDEIRLAQGERHRLVGLSSWGVLAEIWQHTDENQPSDEDDIIRVQDDFGR
ncbi:phosphoheptose isomerase [Fulvivirga sp.]|uniref:phosphoheptose isomerase n=1 Tax=Fulvivirga sp. TaxID=1931237 RepID=UPI0032EC1CF5